MRRLTALRLLLVVLLVTPATALAQGGDGGFGISAESSVDTPDRTVTVEGAEYRVSSVARVASGDPVTLSTTAPGDAGYDVYLYNGDRQVVATTAASGASSWTLDSSDYAPGSYVVAIYRGGQYEAVQPLVFAAYDVRVNAPNAVERGSAVEVEVEVSPVADGGDRSSVEVVLTGEGVTRRVDASRSADGTYTARVPSDVPAGEYRVYASVRGEDAYEDRRELLGISESRSVTVERTTTEPAGGQPGGGDGRSDDGTSSGSESDADAADATTADATTAAPSTPGSSTADPTATERATTDDRPTGTGTPGAVVTPNAVGETTDATATTGDDREATSDRTGRLPTPLRVLSLVALVGAAGFVFRSR